MTRAYDDRIAEAVRDQFSAPKDESAHQDLADLGVGLHQRKRSTVIDLDHFPGLADLRTQHVRRPASSIDLAGELARPVHGNEFLRCPMAGSLRRGPT
jgi:hypothetical protein